MLGLILARVLAVLRTLVMAAVLVRRSAVMVREGCRRHSCQDDCRRGRYDCALEFHVASPSFIQFVDSDANGHRTGEPWLHPVGDCARAHRPSWGSSRRKGVRAASQDARPSTSAAACSMGRACGRCGIADMRGAVGVVPPRRPFGRVHPHLRKSTCSGVVSLQSTSAIGRTPRRPYSPLASRASGATHAENLIGQGSLELRSGAPRGGGARRRIGAVGSLQLASQKVLEEGSGDVVVSGRQCS